jgi:hypothetical protein
MNTKNLFSTSLSGFAALILIATPAFANTESFSFDLSQTALTASSAVNDSFTLGAFDPSLGTLTGVTLVMDLTTTASPQVINLSGGPGTYANTTTSFFSTFTGPDGTAASYKAVSLIDAGSVSGAQLTTTTLTGTPVDSSTSTSVIPANFSSYEGTNPLSFTLVAPGTSQFTSGGTATSGVLAFGGSGSVGGTAFVEYTFAATPEPSTWALGIICMVLFVSLRFCVRRAAY